MFSKMFAGRGPNVRFFSKKFGT